MRGARVLVPLGRRTVTGIVIGPAEGSESEGVRDVLEIVDSAAFLPDEVVDLALWVANYYLAAPGDALATAAPTFAWVESERHYELTDEGRRLLDGPGGEHPQLRALSRGSRSLRSLVGKAESRKVVETTLRGFERKGLVRRIHTLPARRAGFRTEWLASLTPAGASAAEA